MALSTPAYAWLDGGIVPWDACVLHARAPGGFWGANVFEGIRGYWSEDDAQLYAFRVGDHLARLGRSMKCMRMAVPWPAPELARACLELLRANDFRTDVHVTVTAYFDLAETFDPMSYTTKAGVHITAVPAPSVGGRAEHGVHVCVSSWRRIGDDTMPPRIKTGANYQNSRLAHQEAVRNGFDTALFLNQRGTLAEGPGSCLVVVRDGELVTPPGTSGVLEGITVASVAEITAREFGLPLHRREIDRTELYVADEAFLCGTMHELMPIVSVDRLPVGDGSPGPLTRRIHQRYLQAVHGDPAYRHWVTPTYQQQEVDA